MFPPITSPPTNVIANHRHPNHRRVFAGDDNPYLSLPGLLILQTTSSSTSPARHTNLYTISHSSITIRLTFKNLLKMSFHHESENPHINRSRSNSFEATAARRMEQGQHVDLTRTSSVVSETIAEDNEDEHVLGAKDTVDIKKPS